MISCNKRRVSGFTIFETLLVLAIAASILLIGIRQYRTYRIDADVQALKYNVDTIFEALNAFYKVNCYGTSSSSSIGYPYGQIDPGLLNPNNASFPTGGNPKAIDITKDLVKKGFWPISLPTPTPSNPLIENPIVDSGGMGMNGYVAQFNQYATQRKVCTQPKTMTTVVLDPYDTTTCTTAATMATIIIWKEQVAIKLAAEIASDPVLAQDYLNLLGGDCLSSASGNTVTPCPSFGAIGGDYVVWERLPAQSSPKSASSYWFTTPTVEQFRQMYTTYPILILISTPPATSQGTINPGTKLQYIYCGT